MLTNGIRCRLELLLGISLVREFLLCDTIVPSFSASTVAVGISKIVTALATGNVVIFKPSEVTPLSTLKLAELVNAAGFPPGVVNVVNGYGKDVGQALSDHPDIGKITFTGSTLTGRKIMESAAKTNLKRVTLELGGKSPTIIFDDANLEKAVPGVIRNTLCGEEH